MLLRSNSRYINIANILISKGDSEKAIEYFFKSLKIGEELDNKTLISDSFINIGITYMNQGFYGKAMEFFNKSLKIKEKLGEIAREATIYGNIASLYIKLADSLSSVHEQPNTKKLATSYYDSALFFGNKAYLISLDINAIPLQKKISSVLTKAYKQLGRYDDALNFSEIFIATSNIIFNEEKIKAITEMQTKYETEKKQQEIEKQQLVIEKQEIDNRRQRNQRNFFIVGTFFLALLALVIFRGYQQKKKSNAIITEKNVLLEQANEEIAAQRDLVTEQKEHIEEIHGELTASIRYARRIQGAVLPSPVQMNELLGNHFVLFKPKDIVSGDFYWATRVRNYLVFCVADCTGHGVPGAFMSMLGVSFLNDIVHKESVTSAADVLNHLRDSVIGALKQRGEGSEQKDGMDMGLCVINTETKQMQFAGGYNPCWVIPNPEFSNSRIFNVNEEEESGIIQLKPDKMPIAIHKHMEPYTNHLLQLYPGDQVYLMSDGFQDQFGGSQGKKFMVKNLRELMLSNSKLTMDQQCSALDEALEEWMDGVEQVDDITVLGYKINEKEL